MRHFQVIPAVDLLAGKVVRLFQGDYSKSTVYGEDPAEPILKFVEAGATLIHVVDLDAAKEGDRTINAQAIQRILDELDGRAKIEIGGGIRNMEAMVAYDRLGVDRFILGTAAVKNPDLVRQAIQEYGPSRVIVGVDARDGIVKVSGWEKGSGVRATDFVGDLDRAGVEEVIFTDIETDGALTGPAINSIQEILGSCRLNLIASGGIASNEDINRLLSLNEPRIIGAITGRAIYEGKLDLALAIDTAISHYR